MPELSESAILATRRLLRSAFGLLFVVAVFCGGVLARAAELNADRLLSADHVVEVSIELPEADWQQLCNQNRDIGKAFSGIAEDPFTYVPADITVDGVTIRKVGLRKKGFLGSLDNQFPSLKVKFDEYEQQRPIAGLEKLTLNNNKQDPSLVSQLLSYQLFRAAGIQAPRCNFARVTVNGKYLGIYTNVESIDEEFLQRRFGSDSGNLYEGTLADFYPSAVDRLVAKTNKKDHDRSKLVRLAEILNTSEKLDLGEVEKLVDVDNFLKYWAMESLIGFWDGYSNNQNNFWVYDNPENGKLYFIPWGADGAMLRQGGLFGIGGFPISTVYAEAMLANQLYREPEVAERYRQTMVQLLQTVWKEEDLLQEIDRVETLLKDKLHPRQSNLAKNMNSVRQFIRTRRKAVERDLERWPMKVASQPRRPLYVVPIGAVQGKFQTTWVTEQTAGEPSQNSLEAEFQFDGQVVQMRELTATVTRTQRRGPFGASGSAERNEVIKLAVSGKRELDGRGVSIEILLDEAQWRSNSGKPIEVEGEYSLGSSNFLMPFSLTRVNGQLTVSKFGTNSGDPVEGTFALELTEARGGMFDGERRDGSAKPEAAAAKP